MGPLHLNPKDSPVFLGNLLDVSVNKTFTSFSFPSAHDKPGKLYTSEGTGPFSDKPKHLQSADALNIPYSTLFTTC